MLKKNLYIPIEVKAREYVSNLLLTSRGIDRNFRCYLGAKSSINKLIQYSTIKSGVYFSKSPLLETEYIEIKKKCEFFTILDQELGPALSVNEIEKGLLARKNLIIPEFIDSYYVLGNRILNIVKKIYPEIKSAIKLTGWPRIDIWKKYNFLYQKKSQHIKKKYGNFILFASDFSFLTKKNIDEYLVYLKSYNHKEDDQSYIYAKKRAESTYQEFRKILRIFFKLDKLNLENEIIIRPHPADNHIFWNKIKKKFKKIKVIYEGDISEWLYAANGLMHRGCTTGVQSMISKIPTAYIVTDEELIRKTLTYDISEKLKNFDEIKKFINEPKNKEKKIKLDEQIYFNQDISASEHIINDLENFKMLKSNPIKVGLYNIIKEFFKAIKTNLRGKDKNFVAKVGDGINSKETIEYLELIRKKKDFKVIKVFKNCLMIEKNKS